MRRSPSMPVARIYASLVEEAEPICADLLARGYNVEVVFPDAVLPTPADLELRVERCSAEQAIARVEAGGSPSRCVFMTPSKGPRRELLLVEMTVLATGTDGRHPMAMPIAIPAALPMLLTTPTAAIVEERSPRVPADRVPAEPAEARGADASLAEVLPFPAAPPEPRVDDVNKMEPARLLRKDQYLSGNFIAELNDFLAHAPTVEPPEGLHVRIFENMRHSANAERARKNWEGLALAGVAASLVFLIAFGWYAGPNRPRQGASATASRVAQPAPLGALPESSSVLRVAPETLKTVGLVMETSSVPASVPLRRVTRRHSVHRHRRLSPRIQDEYVAQDEVTRAVRQPGSHSLSVKTVQPTTTSELIRPPAMRSSPVKIITDLK